jgi:hypothetical protein
LQGNLKTTCPKEKGKKRAKKSKTEKLSRTKKHRNVMGMGKSENKTETT